MVSQRQRRGAEDSAADIMGAARASRRAQVKPGRKVREG
jgi:hypothetical protein